MTPPLLSIRDVSKRFGETVALADAGLDLHAGEVHALLGANGSGKSTLIKILAGVEQGDAGEITVVGREVRAQDMNPTIAHDCHLRFVHQQGSTFGSLSVAENLAAGTAYPRRRFGRIDWRRLRREARATLQRFGVDADPAQPMESLRPATQQMVTITRLLQSQPGAGGGVLVLDEPTAALARPEVVLLHDALRRFAGAGHSILYVTHRLDELAGFVDRATVLREGRVVGRLGADEIDHERLVELIAGALLEVEVAAQQARAVGPSEERLRLRDLRGGAIERANLGARAGEIVGLAGLAGSGRSSLLEMVFGIRQPEDGAIELDGTPLRWRGGVPHPSVAYVPEDRVRDGAFMPLTLTENVMAASTSRFWRHLRVNHGDELRATQTVIREQQIVAGSATVPFRTLSGGNQQKAILGRWLMRDPAVLLLDEPTQGVDVGARAAIHQTIREFVAGGRAAVVASSDADELALLCDRVVLLVRGTTTAELAGDELDAERIERMSYGSGRAATSTIDDTQGDTASGD